MEAYIIQQEGPQYWNEDMFLWTETLYLATFYGTKKYAKEIIKENKLKLCLPIKVEIRKVEE